MTGDGSLLVVVVLVVHSQPKFHPRGVRVTSWKLKLNQDMGWLSGMVTQPIIGGEVDGDRT